MKTSKILMVLTDLGTRTVSVEDEWRNFSTINIQLNLTYIVEILISSANPGLVYSKFLFRIRGATPDTNRIYSPSLGEYYVDDDTQYLQFMFNDNFIDSRPARLQVRRFPLFSGYGNLADAEVNLKIDLDNTA